VEEDVFEDNNYIVKKIDESFALQVRDTYKDTVIYSRLKKNMYPTRLLTTAFLAADGNYYELKLVSHEIDKGKLIQKVATSLFWLYLLLFASSILVNNFVLKKTWEPFYQLLKYLNEFRLDRGAIPKPAQTKIQEFRLLDDSVKKLVKTNVDIFNNQKQFIENVSHELQTPLAIGINKLELFAGEGNLSEEQIQTLGNIIETFRRLSGLNKSLLLFSKIENRQYISTKQIHFDKIFTRLIHDFIDYAEYQRITIDYQKDGDWSFEMNKDLAEILTMNLVKNAIIHNLQGGEVRIKLTSSSFRIENTAKEPKQLADQLFDRFAKKSKEISSTGLGLAIVRAIVDVSGLKLSYSFDGKHVFEVRE
jgi:signal transduction histidine kinase